MVFLSWQLIKGFLVSKHRSWKKREIKKEGGKRKLSKTLFAIMTGVCVHSFPQNSRDFKNFSCVYLTCLLFYYLKSIKRFVKLQFELEIDSQFCNNIVIKLSCFTFHQRYPDKIYIFWRQGKKRMVCLNEWLNEIEVHHNLRWLVILIWYTNYVDTKGGEHREFIANKT